MKRLWILLFVLLSSCVEVDQHLTIRPDGSIGFHWRVGLRAEIAAATRQKDDDDAWLRAVRATGPGVEASIATEGDTTWLDVSAEFVDGDTYEAFRQRFVEDFHRRYRNPQTFLFPPQARSGSTGWHVVLDVPRATEALDYDPERVPEMWRLRVTPSGEVSAHNATRVLDDGTLLWESRTAAVVNEGIRAEARFEAPGLTGWSVLPLVLAAVLIFGGAAIWLATREERPPPASRSP